MSGRLQCFWFVALLTVPAGSSVQAQSPTFGGGGFGASAPPRYGSSLGLMPGGGGNLFGNAPGSERPIIGGGPGTMTPIAPPSISDPSFGNYQNLGGMGVGMTPELPSAELPVFGVLALPGDEDPGPPDGLTLDDALERLVRENLDLRSRFMEIPQARADILTASLYANPLVFFDTQLVPYGNFSRERPGGPTQYDLNVSHPLDISGKRRARVQVASAAEKVIEAQYQDAVRMEIANLYEAYLGALLARESIRFSRAALSGLDAVLETIRDRREHQIATRADVDGVLVQRELAASGLLDAEQTYRGAKVRLGALLAIPEAQAERIELRGTLKVDAPAPPLGEELRDLALKCRPDLSAYRLGVRRSRADVDLALANRLADVYVLYQPFTHQDNSPFGAQSATSWAAGLTIPVPLYNRNQGNIRRARLNVDQSKVELAAQELRAITEVSQAEKEYQTARANVQRMERAIRPAADRVLQTAELRWQSGEKDILFYLAALRDYNTFARQYLADWLRYRRSMLRLNTVVGQRILP